MLLQCPVCRLNARVPRNLEGKAVECPRCKAVGYAGRRPGGLANLKPIHDAMETDPVADYLNSIEEELAGPLPEELFRNALEDVAFYDLPGEPQYEDMLMAELGDVVKKPAAHGYAGRLARRERWVRREKNPAAAHAPFTTALLCRCGFGTEMAEEYRGRTVECPVCSERVVVGSPPEGVAVALSGLHPERKTAPAPDPTIIADNGLTQMPGTSWGEGVGQRRAYPRVEASGLAVEMEHGKRLPLCNISVSGLGIKAGAAHDLQPGKHCRLRLAHDGDGATRVPAMLLKELGLLEARVVRADDGGAGLVFENLNGFRIRHLAGLVARMARQGNQDSIPDMPEAQGF